MCGRYYRRSDKQQIAEAFKLGELPDGLVLPPGDYNVAPSTFQPIIRAHKETGERQLEIMRWGTIPSFAKSLAEFKSLSTMTETVHNRMPVLIKPSEYDRWLARDAERPPVDLLRPYEADKMTAHPLDPRVGNVRNNESGLCDLVPVSLPLNTGPVLVP